VINRRFLNILKNHPRGLILKELQCIATAGLLKILQRKKNQIQLLYRGDILYPSIQSGDELIIEKSKELRRGDFVLFIDDEGIPDLMRFLKKEHGFFILGAEAIALKKMKIRSESVLGVVRAIYRGEEHIPYKKSFSRPLLFSLYSSLNSLFREMIEIFHRPHFHDENEAVKKVGEKYEIDAQYFPKDYSCESETFNFNIMKKFISEGEKVLILGSGTGSEAISLAKGGCTVLGIDLSPKRIEIAREKTKEANIDVQFAVMDASHLTLKDSDYTSVIFTPDVYSYIPNKKARVNILKGLSQRLAPDGKILFNIKYYPSFRSYMKINISNILHNLMFFGRKSRKSEFGDWHTKFLDLKGKIQFSYCKFFRRSEIKKEIEQAGYEILDNVQRVWIIKRRQ
jgi:ubiquinone/menaquinone biosynthesis C-methylase UbiE